MMDLRNHLENISQPVAPPSAEQVGADIARGRKALRRRRAGQTLAGSAFGVAALVAVLTVAAGGTGAGPQDPAPGTNRPAVIAAAQLVAYKGKQPNGFTVDKVPDGWFVQGDEKFNLVLAPVRAKNPGPDVDPSKQPLFDPRDYTGKIAMWLVSGTQSAPPKTGTSVQVGDRTGTLMKSMAEFPGPAGADTGWVLWVKQPSGAYLVVQFWEGLGMSQNRMVELVAGVHVHQAALDSVG